MESLPDGKLTRQAAPMGPSRATFWLHSPMSDWVKASTDGGESDVSGDDGNEAGNRSLRSPRAPGQP
jgi:hypothetical protein